MRHLRRLRQNNPAQRHNRRHRLRSLRIRTLPQIYQRVALRPACSANWGLGLIVFVAVWLSWRYAQRPKQIRQRALERCRKDLLKQIQNQNFDNIQSLVSDYLTQRYGLTHNKAREAWINDQPEAATFLHLLDQSSYDQKTKKPSGDRILQLAANLLNTKPAKAQKEKRRALLPALYPQTR